MTDKTLYHSTYKLNYRKDAFKAYSNKSWFMSWNTTMRHVLCIHNLKQNEDMQVNISVRFVYFHLENTSSLKNLFVSKCNM
jgi:hypothetical protein